MSVPIPFLDLPSQHKELQAELLLAFKEVLETCSFCSGPYVESFEKEFAKFIHSKEAVGVSSGTSALHLALLAAGIGPGDEVIAPAMTFLATVSAIEYVGAKPVLVDVEPDTYCINSDLIESAITEKTKAIIPVHLYGQPANMIPIKSLAEKYELTIIEDASQAHGASIAGMPCGSIGDFATFSFYPGKNLGACGEGGAVTTNDLAKAELIRSMRDWGQVGKGNHVNPGFNYRMDGLQGTALKIKLKYLRDWTDARIRIAAMYNKLLEGFNGISIPIIREKSKHVFHVYAVLVKNRDQVIEKMRQASVYCSVHYPLPIHLQSRLSYLGYSNGDFPIAEKLSQEELSLPIHPNLKDEQCSQVIKILTG